MWVSIANVAGGAVVVVYLNYLTPGASGLSRGNGRTSVYVAGGDGAHRRLGRAVPAAAGVGAGFRDPAAGYGWRTARPHARAARQPGGTHRVPRRDGTRGWSRVHRGGGQVGG